MDLPTYTNIWRIEKRLYKLYDFRLPMPLPVVTLGVFLGVCAVWFALLGLLRVPFETPWHVLWLVPPGLITFFATRPVLEGKRLTEVLISQARFLSEARVYTRLAPEREPGEITVTVRVWHRDPAAGPLPEVRRKAVRAGKAEKKTTIRGQPPVAAPEAAPVLDAPARTSGPKELERVREGRRAEAERSATGAPVAPPRTHAVKPEEWVRGAAEAVSGPTSGAGEPAAHTDILPLGEERPREESVASAVTTGTGLARSEPTLAPPSTRVPEERSEGPGGAREHVPERPADNRGVGLRVLNYFGFALHKVPRQDGTGELGPGPATRSRGTDPRARRAARARPDGDPAPIPGAPGIPEELAEALRVEKAGEKDTEWFGGPRAIPGDTPYPLSSETASEAADTVDDGKEIGDGGSVVARRRAEEMMAAPDPHDESGNDEPGTRSAESASPGPAREDSDGGDRVWSSRRRLRGRSRGVEISGRREREQRATGDDQHGEGITSAADVRPEAEPTTVGDPAGARERATAPPPPESPRARGVAKPATPWEAREEAREHDRARLRGRPHAEPWNLPGRDRDTPAVGTRQSADAPDNPRRPTGSVGSAKPGLQLDHGTDEHQSLSQVLGFPAEGATNRQPERRGGEEGTSARGHHDGEKERMRGGAPETPTPAEHGDRMSVLNQHLNKSDTPPSPPPRFVDPSGDERPATPRALSGWFSGSDQAESPAGAGAPPAHGSKSPPREGQRPPENAEPSKAPAFGATNTEHGAGPSGPGGRADERAWRDPRGTPAAVGHDGGPSRRADVASSGNTSDGAREDRRSPESTTPKNRPAATEPGSRDSGAPRRAEADASRGERGDSRADKPSLELDHGTGEHERFSTIQNPPRRATAADLEVAEAAAIRARQRWAARRAEKGMSTGGAEVPEPTESGSGGTAAPGGGNSGADPGVSRAADATAEPGERGQIGVEGASPAKASSATRREPGTEGESREADEVPTGTAAEDGEEATDDAAPVVRAAHREANTDGAEQDGARASECSVSGEAGGALGDSTGDGASTVSVSRSAPRATVAKADRTRTARPKPAADGQRVSFGGVFEPHADAAGTGPSERAKDTDTSVEARGAEGSGGPAPERPTKPAVDPAVARRSPRLSRAIRAHHPRRPRGSAPTAGTAQPSAHAPSRVEPGSGDTHDGSARRDTRAEPAAQAGPAVAAAEVRGQEDAAHHPVGPAAGEPAPECSVGGEAPSDAPARRETVEPDDGEWPFEDAGAASGTSGRVEGDEAAPGEAAGTRSPGNAPGDTAGSGTAQEESAGAHAPRPDKRSGMVTSQPDDGVFDRVAQNARRISHLFGQPAPGESPQETRERSSTPSGGTSGATKSAGRDKPALQLDHGTGEQRQMAESPGGGTPTELRRDRRARPATGARDDDTPGSGGTRGWRRLARVVKGETGAMPAFDLPESDTERVLTPVDGPRRVVVLGCTGGAGQSLTTLVLGHTLAAHRDDRVVAVDINPGPGGLSRRISTETPETVTSLLANIDAVSGYMAMRGYTSTQPRTGLEVVSTLDDPYVQTLDDRDFVGLTGLLGKYYGLTLLDPAATGVARALPIVDGLVLVAPASADAARAVAMTFEWLDGHGYAHLRSTSIVVVNGVSKRSLSDVDDAERVARGRCRAIVRIPWDDHLVAPRGTVDIKALRSATRRSVGALAGVLMHSFRTDETAANGGEETVDPASESRTTREVPR